MKRSVREMMYSSTNANILDIEIVDLKGNHYEINKLYVKGNDYMKIEIKKPEEEYK